jgi:hypothetical protein
MVRSGLQHLFLVRAKLLGIRWAYQARFFRLRQLSIREIESEELGQKVPLRVLPYLLMADQEAYKTVFRPHSGS